MGAGKDILEDISIEAADLAAGVSSIVGSGSVAANYHSGDWLRVHGVRRTLVIAVDNSELNERPPGDVDAVASRIAEAGREWLEGRRLLKPGTLITVQFSRSTDLKLVSWSRGVTGRIYWIDEGGRVTTESPPDDIAEE